jgi:hypothetical protein
VSDIVPLQHAAPVGFGETHADLGHERMFVVAGLFVLAEWVQFVANGVILLL